MKTQNYPAISEKLSKPVLIGLLVTFGFFGYDALLFLIFGYGRSGMSQAFTVPFRVLSVIISICWVYVMMRQRRSSLKPMYFVAILAFWLFYLGRITHDTLLVNAPLTYSPAEYFMRYFGMLVVPAFAFMFRFTRREARIGSKVSIISSTAALLLGFFLYRKFLGQDYRRLAYLGVERDELISPLTFSYLGAACAIMGTYYIFTIHRLKVRHVLLMVSAWILGVSGIFYGSSRGAILGMIVALLPLTFAPKLKRKWKSAPLVIIIVATCSLSLYFASGLIATNMGYRMQTLEGEFGEDFGSGRGEIWTQTLAEIATSPVIGSGLTEKVTAYAPHNYILEAFMTTGVLGGLLFTVLMAIGVWVAVKRIRECTEYSWIAGLFLLYFSQGMVSGSLLSGQYWFTLLATLMIPTHFTGSTTVASLHEMTRWKGRAGIVDNKQGDAMMSDSTARISCSIRCRQPGPNLCR